MESLFLSIEDWFREILISGIMNNLAGTFDSVNHQMGLIATEVGKTPATFSPGIFNMIRTLSENVIMPILRVGNHKLIKREKFAKQLDELFELK